jgi:hypothetical protein
MQTEATPTRRHSAAGHPAIIPRACPFIVEGGIPLQMPTARGTKYPFRDMAAGDSFLVSEKDSLSARAASRQFGKRHGQKFSVRKTPTGYRCWRLEDASASGQAAGGSDCGAAAEGSRAVELRAMLDAHRANYSPVIRVGNEVVA